MATLKSEVADVRKDLKFELVFVDDGSPDRSLDVLLDL